MRRSQVNEAVRNAREQDELARTPAERIKLALKLGRRDLELLRASQGGELSLDEVRALRVQQQQLGRRRTRCY